MKRWKVGVVGMGTMGQRHLRHLWANPRVDKLYAFSRDSEKREKIYRTFGIECPNSLEEFYEKGIEVALICTDTGSHAGQTIVAANHKAAVFVEKPMANNVEQCEQMIKACRENGVELMVGYKKRFLPSFQMLSDEVTNELGPVKLFHYEYVNPYYGEKEWLWDDNSGGGPLLDCACHALDLVRFLFGRIREMDVTGGNFFNPKFAPQQDMAAVKLKCDNGTIGTLTVGMPGVFYERERLTCFHEKGFSEVSGFFDMPEILEYQKRGSEQIKRKVFSIYNFVHDELTVEVDEFLKSMEEGRGSPIPAEESKEVVRLCWQLKMCKDMSKCGP